MILYFISGNLLTFINDKLLDHLCESVRTCKHTTQFYNSLNHDLSCHKMQIPVLVDDLFLDWIGKWENAIQYILLYSLSANEFSQFSILIKYGIGNVCKSNIKFLLLV